MDAATAAILAALVAGTAGASGALLAPHLTAKRTRETRLLEMRRDAYIAAIQQVDLFSKDDTADGMREVARGMFGPSVQLELLGSPDAAPLYSSVHDALVKLSDRMENDEDIDENIGQVVKALRLFIETARAHMGVDDLDR